MTGTIGFDMIFSCFCMCVKWVIIKGKKQNKTKKAGVERKNIIYREGGQEKQHKKGKKKEGKKGERQEGREGGRKEKKKEKIRGSDHS